MTPRDATLLPRLLLTLDTLDNDAEIVTTVRSVRRILATDGRKISDFAGVNSPARDELTLQDQRHFVSSRLHGLGTMLRGLHLRNPEVMDAVERARLAITVGSIASGADLRLLLAILRELLQQGIEREREAKAEREAAGANWTPLGVALETVLQATREQMLHRRGPPWDNEG